MTTLADIEGGRKWLKEAVDGGVVSRQLYRQRVLRDGMLPKEAATTPLRSRGRKPDPRSVLQKCRRHGISRAAYYHEKARRKEAGLETTDQAIFISLKARKAK